MENVLVNRVLATRRGTLALGGCAAALAALIVLLYLNNYRDTVNAASAPMTVLVAKTLIPKGTSGTLVASNGLFQAATVPRGQLKPGAIADPAAIRERAATADIYPGQQLTVRDFSVAASTSISSRLSGDERAVTVEIDAAHGLLGQLQTGDSVDIWVAFAEGGATGNRPLLKLLVPNVLVMAAPSAASGTVALRLKAKHAPVVAFAAETARLWFTLRPPTRAQPTKPDVVTVETLLVGAKPLARKGS